MVQRKHIPQRTCISCRQVRQKRELVRIVNTVGAGVMVDPTSKRSGRGAYLCRASSCWDRALASKSHLLDHALKTTLTDGERAALSDFAQSLPAALATQGTAEADAVASSRL